MTRPRAANRAQTSIDFVVAMGVFFVAIAFVFAFVPAMFAPFFGMGASDALMTDRSAAYLAEDELVNTSGTPGVLDEVAVDAFFDDCDGGGWLSSELGVDSDAINVTIGEDRCGPRPDGSETVSTRIVSVNGSQETLRVVVW